MMDEPDDALSRDLPLPPLAGGTNAYQAEISALRQSEQRYRLIADMTWDWEFWMNTDQVMAYTSPSCERISGYPSESLQSLTQLLDIVHPEDRADVRQEMDRALEQQSRDGYDLRIIRPDGSVQWVSLAYRPVYEPGGAFQGVRGSIRDIRQRKKREALLQARLQQQTAVARLGELALSGASLPQLFDESVRTITATLGVDYARVAELLPGGERLLVQAAAGWDEGQMDRLLIDAQAGSQSGYALASNEPVVMEDLAAERRFQTGADLAAHGESSRVSVIIHGRGRPYGTLSAFARQGQSFSPEDMDYLQSMANVLGMAVVRQQAEQVRDRLIDILEQTPDLVSTAGLDGQVIYLNRAAREVMGIADAAELSDWSIPARHPAWAAERIVEEGIPGAMRDGVWRGETAVLRHDGQAIPTSQVIIAHRAADGSVDCLSSIARDITEQQRLLTENQQQRAFVERLFDAMTDAVVVYDAHGRLVQANPAAIAAYGFNPIDEDIERIAERLALREPGGRRLSLEQVPAWRAVHGQVVPAQQMTLTDAHGRAHTISASAAPLWLEGLLMGAIVVWHDLTEAAEAASRVEQLLAEVQRANERLAEQAEEQQVQAEELRTQNEELFALTERLGVEQERLSRQAEEMEVQAEEMRAQNEELAAISRLLESERGRLQAIIEQMPGGVVIAEAPSGRVVLVNRRTEELLRGPYPPPAGPHEYVQFASFYPDGRPYPPEEMPLARAVTRGESVTNEEIHYVRGDGSRGVQMVSARPIRDRQGNITAAAIVFVDITERKEMEEALRQARDVLELRVRERTADLERANKALQEGEDRYRVVSELTSDYVYQLRVDPDGTMEGTLVTDGFQRLTGFSLDDVKRVPDWSRFIHPDDVEGAVEFFTRVLATQRADSREMRMVTTAGDILWTEVYARPRWDEEQQRITAIEGAVKDVTERVQARRLLELRVAERTRELTTLLAASNSLTARLEIGSLLNAMADQLQEVVDYTGLVIYERHGDELEVVEYRGPLPRGEALHQRVPVHATVGLRTVVEERRPVIIADVQGSDEMAQAWQAGVHPLQARLIGPARSWLGVPLLEKGTVTGILRLGHDDPEYFSAHHAALALAFASHAAVAIENARLYGQAQTLAAIEERQRLARDLHDAVSQTLFSASLTADVLPTLYERDPVHGKQLLADLRELNRGALAEMRMLLVELRPAALMETDLPTLLRHLAEAAAARAHLKTEVVAQSPGKLPAEVQVGLYRVAQEAINNVIKHARATSLTVGLSGTSHTPGAGKQAWEMSIVDNGQGFDVTQVAPQCLGLGIMAERVASIGAEMTLDSVPGEGTRVRVVWKA